MRIQLGNRRGRGAKPTSVGGKIGLTLFFFVFFAMGAVFFAVLVGTFLRDLSTYGWHATDATITHSAVEQDGNGNHRLHVRYEYAVDGRPYTAGGYDRPDDEGYTHDDYSVLERLAARYPVGAHSTAYVQPSDPSRAILAHPSLWIGLVALFPLIFVAIGVGGIYFTWFGSSNETRSIAGRSKSKQLSGKWVLRVMGVVFTAVGLAAAYFILILPVVRVARAKSWTPVPATVVASRVVSHQGDDSTTYSVDILYEYKVDGRQLRSNRYHFMTGSSSGRSAKQAIVDAHPPGKEITAYVNPADPFDAVVDRGYPDDLWFGLIPLVFCVAGAAMFVGSFYLRGASRSEGAAWMPEAATVEQPGVLPAAGRSGKGPVTLRPTTSPVGKLVGVLFIAVIWNGITSIFVTMAVNSHLAGNPEWFLTIFIIPFVLVGIGLIAAVPYQFLALFNPSPILEVSTAAPALGDTLAVQWRLEGRADRVSTLTLSLVGEEQATYRRGTNTVTDKHKFYDERVLNTSEPGEILRGGRLDVLIPADVMHSFDAGNNKITWTLKMHGDIKRWPDMKHEFGLIVRPMAPAEISHA